MQFEELLLWWFLWEHFWWLKKYFKRVVIVLGWDEFEDSFGRLMLWSLLR